MENVAINAVVITISDTRAKDTDVSGVTLAGLLLQIEAKIVEKLIISDELDDIRSTLFVIAEREDVNLIVTTGGTGLGPRDNTPEATLRVIEREVPGIAEAIRAESLKITPMAMISRGVCGVSGGTLIVNLPGSPKAVKESFAVIKPVLSHAADLLAGKTQHTSN